MKKWKKEDIKELLETNDVAVIKGLIRIYELQTSDEQSDEYTKHHNGVGFSGFDGEFMTSVAKWFLKNGFVSEGQFKHVKKKMMRYAGQLAKIANGEIVPSYREKFKIFKGWLRKKNAA
jgi:hypothetical protein